MKTMYVLYDTGGAEESAYQDGIADRSEMTEQEVSEANECLRKQGSQLRWIENKKPCPFTEEVHGDSECLDMDLHY